MVKLRESGVFALAGNDWDVAIAKPIGDAEKLEELIGGELTLK